MARSGGEEAVSKQRMQYRGLRGWLEQVDKLGELTKVDGASWDVEMGAITHMLTETSRRHLPGIGRVVRPIRLLGVMTLIPNGDVAFDVAELGNEHRFDRGR